ncbi:peptidoglycan bridge formation glycyltransferase FemA/FemB family protein [Patescibacteria group bacterium]|nr:peptidoglycan bridge formation glycyltransferase FemA/FemB family protein [Patescibacteria group bacterium]MBU1034377.1 peptidoglycan bridge formation glycyltransferase FemA/FemB family protein [Patescibacteria group bacterium]MBU1630061.1 peptidoglycan bridge formation glycyltransferase FemA/FemB family protein [Patescibacteria group bacterium]MBU1908075.1 peptidoglycan bridge formation glycyltransferase FemA/FemB family protein [Patescibacteria group bacterium]
MKLVEITKPELWDDFQNAQRFAQFTQAWKWGEFRRSCGLDVRRFALVDEAGAWLAAVQMEFRPKKFVGGYWFAPRGPVFSRHVGDDDKREIFQTLLENLKRQKMARALFWRFEPLAALGHPEGLMPLSMRRIFSANPASTMILDLTPSIAEISGKLKQKTRYNIRVAERGKVLVRLVEKTEDMDAFLDLMDETAKRDKFVQHDREYLRKLAENGIAAGTARLRLAVSAGKVLAANLEMLCEDTVTYLHGASSSRDRQLMAPYLLHWDAILQAKRDGYSYYDFWGINPLSKGAFAYKRSWEGITRFKEGWGGERLDLYGTWDLPLNLPLYRLIFYRLGWRS